MAALTVAEMTLRGLSRRRGALVLMLLLPLSFYLARHDLAGQSVRFLALGLAWAASTLALFAALDARGSEPRLVVGGWPRRHLVGGRVGAVTAAVAVLAAGYTLLVAVDRQVPDVAGVALMLGVTAVVAVALGSALGAVVARELEGALLLFTVAGLQFVADPATAFAHVLPFWSTRELGTYAIDGPQAASAAAALGHGAAVVAACSVAVALATAARLRRRPHPAPAA